MNVTRPDEHEMDETSEDGAKIAVALRRSLLVIGGVALIVVAVWGAMRYWPKGVDAPPPKEIVSAERRENRVESVPTVKFTDITAEAGINFVHVNGASPLKLLPETMGGGVAFFDYDGDGDADLLFVNSDYWPGERPADAAAPTMHLYRNDGKGKFEDVTTGSGLDVTFYGMGVAIGDFDADGRPDVYLTAVGPNRLFRNLGDGRFEDVTASAGVAGGNDEWSTSAGFCDFDRDGDLDLFVCNYIEWSRELNVQLRPTLDGKNRAYAPPTQFKGRFPYLFRNEGNGKFTEIGEAAGLQVRNPATGVPVPKALAATFVDYDRDGWVDVLVASDTVPNQVFHNRGDGTFEEVGQLIGMAFDPRGLATGAMGIDAGYHRNDESLSVVIGNFADEPTSLFLWKPRFAAFTDDALPTGLGPATREELTFGVLWLDYDLDGRLDFLSCNGHLEHEIATIRAHQRYEQPPHLFWNAGVGQPNEFVSVPEERCGKQLCVPMAGRGSAVADIDSDGDLDVILTASGAAPRLLRNDQQLGHHWLQVELVDQKGSRVPVGAEVKLTAGELKQFRTVATTRSYLAQSDPTLVFGLGEIDKVDRLEVRWPDGEVVSYAIEGVDRKVTIQRGQTPALAGPADPKGA